MSTSEVLQALLAALGFLALFILNRLSKSVDKATDSVTALNVRMGVIVEKIERHDKEIDDMRSRQDLARERMHELANNINAIKAKNYE